MLLLVTDSHLPCQDYWMKQPWRTLAYAQALQYWTEKANLAVPNEPCCLAMCVHELRWHMKPYMTFIDHDIFEGLIHEILAVEIKGAMQPNPIESLLVDDLATLTIAPLAPEDGSATPITTPAIPTEDSVALVTPTVLADKPANPHPSRGN